MITVWRHKLVSVNILVFPSRFVGVDETFEPCWGVIIATFDWDVSPRFHLLDLVVLLGILRQKSWPVKRHSDQNYRDQKLKGKSIWLDCLFFISSSDAVHLLWNIAAMDSAWCRWTFWLPWPPDVWTSEASLFPSSAEHSCPWFCLLASPPTLSRRSLFFLGTDRPPSNRRCSSHAAYSSSEAPLRCLRPLKKHRPVYMNLHWLKPQKSSKE